MKKSVLPVYLGARYNVERVGAPAVVVTMIGADELKRKLRPWKTGTRGFNATVRGENKWNTNWIAGQA